MRLAVVTAAVFLLAGCGAGAKPRDAGTSFGHHLRKDGLVLYRASAVLRPPPLKSAALWAAELRAAQPHVHAATLDLAAVRPPANARADMRAILRGFRFTDRLIARLARDVGHRSRVATLRDASALGPRNSEAVFAPFRAAVRDLRRKAYDVGVLSR